MLSEAYTCGGGVVREWAILSQEDAGQAEHAGEAEIDEASNNLRIMRWTELATLHGATDWRLFRRVLQAIEGMAQQKG